MKEKDTVNKNEYINCECGGIYPPYERQCPKCKIANPNKVTYEEFHHVFYDVFYHCFVNFVHAEFDTTKFPEWLYANLSYMFGFIAHTNRRGFIKEYFSSKPNKLRFIEHILSRQTIDYKTEERIIEFLKKEGTLAKWQRRVAREIAYKEKKKIES